VSSIIRTICYIKSITVDILTFHSKYEVQGLFLQHFIQEHTKLISLTGKFIIILYNTNQLNAQVYKLIYNF